MDLIFRMCTPDDYPALTKFWCEQSGWDVIDQQTWEQRFIHTPMGPSEVSVAIDREQGEIMGQVIFIPLAVKAKQGNCRAYRPFALILRQGALQQEHYGNAQGIFMQLYALAVQALSEKGASLIFIMPDPRLARLFRNLSFFRTATFPLYSRSLPLETPFLLPAGYEVEQLDREDPRIDELWERAKGNYPFMVVRDRSSLNWKTSHRGYRYFGVTFRSGLVGLFVALVKTREKQWQICDLLSADDAEDLQTTLMAACNQAYAEYLQAGAGEGLERISVLTVPHMEPYVKKLDFVPADYWFTLAIHPLASMGEEVAPEHWYVSAND